MTASTRSISSFRAWLTAASNISYGGGESVWWTTSSRSMSAERRAQGQFLEAIGNPLLTI